MKSFLSQWTNFRRMKVWQKCALIALPFLVPITALLYLVISQNNDNIAIVNAELRGQEYLRPVKQLVSQLGQHRGLTNRVLSGDKSAEAERSRTATQIDELVRELDAVDSKLGAEFKTPETKRWATIREGWASLRGQVGTLKADVAFEKHNEIISQTLELSTDVWEYSTLALDPVADTYYLQDIAIARVIPGMEDTGKLRDIAVAAIVRQGNMQNGKISFTEDERLQLNILLGTIDGTKNAIEKEVRNMVRANSTLKGKVEGALEDYKSKTNALMAKTRSLLGEDMAAKNASEHFALGIDAVTASSRLYDAYDPLLAELLTARGNGYRKVNYYAAIGSLVGLLVVAFVAFLVTRAITRQINELNKLFGEIDKGNYTKRASVTSQDELGNMTGTLNTMLDNTLTLIQSKDEKDQMQNSIMKLLEDVSGVADGDLTKEAEVTADMTGAIADSFNHMIEQLRGIITNVQRATSKVATTATEIQSSAGHLASGAKTQANQIIHTTSAIEEMSANILQVSENANQSTTVAQQALENARNGNQAVSNTIEGMNRIREQAQETAKRIKRLGETSQEIGQIIQLIDDIADRTGILALNASIQAAAAGEAGRGFAVVAEEVERLAVRSTDATKKISGLVKAIQTETNEAVSAMERNIQEVVSGSRLANQAGNSLQEIENVSRRLAELIQSISIASKQQARGSEALAKSMTEISQITQQTAAGTEQTVESVNDLATLANELRGSISAFQLPSTAA
jgi:twitching motility protein PilJ